MKKIGSTLVTNNVGVQWSILNCTAVYKAACLMACFQISFHPYNIGKTKQITIDFVTCKISEQRTKLWTEESKGSCLHSPYKNQSPIYNSKFNLASAYIQTPFIIYHDN